MKIKQEHIDNLSRWKKSGAKIGSRKVPHHLYAYEQEKYDRAMKYKYLEITQKDRVNLENLWQKVCEARSWKHYVLVKNTDDGTAQIFRDNIMLNSGSNQEMKETMKTLIQ